MTARICVTGDSNAFGSSADPAAAGHSWRQRLALGLSLGSYDAVLVGRSSDADGAHEAQPGRSLSQQRALMPEIVAENTPQIIVMQIGTVTLNSPSSPEALLIDDHYRGLIALTQQLAPMAHLICVSLPPIVPSWTDAGGTIHTYIGAPGIAAFNERLPSIVGKSAWLVAPDADASHMDVVTGPPPVGGDPWPGTHLNFEGHKLFGTAIFGAVTAILDSGLAHRATVEVVLNGQRWTAEGALFRPASEA